MTGSKQNTDANQTLAPALFLLFGTTGDLARKKLFPALFALHDAGYLDPSSTILGIGRRDWDQDQYRDYVAASIRPYQLVQADQLKAFLDRFVYHKLNMDDPSDYPPLWQHVAALEEERQFSGNRIFFLAVSPEYFPSVSHQIGIGQPRRDQAFRRLMIEKPFGRDLPSAKDFNDGLRASFDEHEIFRIDHYLGKEMLQNILVLRFANRLFEPIWNHEQIDHIQISVTEPFGIEQRSGYYDHSGALRDMVQNHLLQLLALLAMERPDAFDTESIRNEKVRLLRALRPFDEASTQANAVFGQYGEGIGKMMRRYLDEQGIAPDSRTETFTALKIQIDNERWQGVPIYLRTGKRLDKHQAKITIVFRHEPSALRASSDEPNILIIRIQPREGIDLRFNIKQPGMTAAITPVHMDFCQNCDPAVSSPQAYEKLIFDAWMGDLGLFTRWDEIEATWTLVDSLQQWRAQMPVFIYPAGSTGPVAADLLLQRDRRQWLDL